MLCFECPSWRGDPGFASEWIFDGSGGNADLVRPQPCFRPARGRNDRTGWTKRKRPRGYPRQPGADSLWNAGGSAGDAATSAGFEPERKAAGDLREEQSVGDRRSCSRQDNPEGTVAFGKGDSPIAGGGVGEHPASGQRRTTELHRIDFFAGRIADLPGECGWEYQGFRGGSRRRGIAVVLYPVAAGACTAADK